MKSLLPILPLLAAAAPPLAVQTTADPALGIWTNPHRTIDIRTEDCGGHLCGTIVAAAPEAVQDAHDAGIDRLIGLSLLRDYRRVSDTRWEGIVYVPGMGRTFSSHIVKVAPDTLRISGCLVGQYLCRSQDWTRR